MLLKITLLVIFFAVMVGGYMATAVNDFIQGLIMLVGIPLTPYLMFELFNGFNGKGWIRSLHYIGAAGPEFGLTNWKTYFYEIFTNRSGGHCGRLVSLLLRGQTYNRGLHLE